MREALDGQDGRGLSPNVVERTSRRNLPGTTALANRSCADDAFRLRLRLRLKAPLLSLNPFLFLTLNLFLLHWAGFLMR